MNEPIRVHINNMHYLVLYLMSVTGTVLGYKMSDDYDSLLTVLRNMNDNQKKLLVEKVQQLVGSTGLEALTQFIANQVNRELFATLIRDFATQVKSGG